MIIICGGGRFRGQGYSDANGVVITNVAQTQLQEESLCDIPLPGLPICIGLIDENAAESEEQLKSHIEQMLGVVHDPVLIRVLDKDLVKWMYNSQVVQSILARANREEEEDDSEGDDQ